MTDFPRKKTGRPRTSTSPRTGRQMARYWVPLEGPCQRCGEAPATDRHHVDGDPLNNVPDNIMLVCRQCHMDVDGRAHGALKKSHCRNGHEYTPENTYVSPKGQRYCRACRKAAKQ